MVSFKSYNINKYRNKLIDKQRSRKYINVYLDSLREFYNLTNNEKNVLFYINSIYNKTETYFIVNSIFYNDCEDKTKVPISSIKSVLYSLKKKGFISNYKDKHNNIIKGCYIIKRNRACLGRNTIGKPFFFTRFKSSLFKYIFSYIFIRYNTKYIFIKFIITIIIW